VGGGGNCVRNCLNLVTVREVCSSIASRAEKGCWFAHGAVKLVGVRVMLGLG
jgi:hypothetical protein